MGKRPTIPRRDTLLIKKTDAPTTCRMFLWLQTPCDENRTQGMSLIVLFYIEENVCSGEKFEFAFWVIVKDVSCLLFSLKGAVKGLRDFTLLTIILRDGNMYSQDNWLRILGGESGKILVPSLEEGDRDRQERFWREKTRGWVLGICWRLFLYFVKVYR